MERGSSRAASSPGDRAEVLQPSLHAAVGYWRRGERVDRLTEAQGTVVDAILVRGAWAHGLRRENARRRIACAPRSVVPPTCRSVYCVQEDYSIPDDFELDKARFGPLSGTTWEERVITAYYSRKLPLKHGRVERGWLCEECGGRGHLPRDCTADFDHGPIPASGASADRFEHP